MTTSGDTEERAQADPGQTPGRDSASDRAAGLADAGWDRASELLTTGWNRARPGATWVTRKVAPLTRRAAQLDLVSVAAGIAVAALGALVIAMVAQIRWQVSPPLNSEIWLVVGATLLTGVVLGALRGFLAVSLYLVMGLVGASWRPEGVDHYLGGPWVGVLLSLPVAALVAGLISSRHATLRSIVTSSWYFFGWFFVAALAGLVVVYAGGLYTLFDRTDPDAWAVFVTMSGRFPFDVAQCVVVAAVGAIIHRLVPSLLRGKRRHWSAERS